MTASNITAEYQYSGTPLKNHYLIYFYILYCLLIKTIHIFYIFNLEPFMN